MILGIGQELDGDDAAGVSVARQLSRRMGESGRWQIIDAGTAPENYAGQIGQWSPDAVIAVDAAQLDQPAGSIHLLDWRETDGMSASSHTLPLTLLGRYLEMTAGCELLVIGIQIGDAQSEPGLSPPVSRAVHEVTEALSKVLNLSL